MGKKERAQEGRLKAREPDPRNPTPSSDGAFALSVRVIQWDESRYGAQKRLIHLMTTTYQHKEKLCTESFLWSGRVCAKQRLPIIEVKKTILPLPV
jgi:hypothetical protein